MRLADRVAVITGAASGIGRATAVAFAREGATVVVADVNDAGGADTVRRIEEGGSGRGTFVHTDVSSASQTQELIRRTAESFGRIDILMNNAVITKGEDILSTDEEAWDQNMSVVLKGVFLCTKAVLPVMVSQGRGSIVNVSSVNGMTGLGGAAYSAAKAGIISLTRTTAVRYGRHGIRVNALCPGTIRTEAWKPILEKCPDVFEMVAPHYPLRRVGEPEEIANAALFLASDESSFATGAVFAIDGGLTAGNAGLDTLFQEIVTY